MNWRGWAGESMEPPVRFGREATVIQCAANVSEGRRQDAIAWIAGEKTVGDAIVADISSDRDHNRTVITWLGSPEALRTAVHGAAKRATEILDLRGHTGVHPRLGAVDVVPFTPVQNASMMQCVRLAHTVGRDLAERLGIPVYFYEAAALPDRPVALPVIRRLARHWPDLDREGEAPPSHDVSRTETPPPLRPDIVPDRPLAGAGATVVGARGPLVAFNVMLDEGDLEAARSIASVIRSARADHPNLRGVRALGLYLSERRQAQVSMNLTHPEETPVAKVYDFVAQEANRIGARAGEAEVIGLLPIGSLAGADLERIRLTSLRPAQIVESWLTSEP